MMARLVYAAVILKIQPLRYPHAVPGATAAGMFPDEQAAAAWLDRIRRPDEQRCPRCATPSADATPDPSGRRWCGSCRRRYSVRTGTSLEGRRAPLRAWVVGMVLSTNGPFVARPEALRSLCGITAGAARAVADGIRAACGGLVCPYDRPERLAGRVLGVSPLPFGPPPDGSGLLSDWWRRLSDGLPARPAGRDRWLTPPRPVWELTVEPPPHPRPGITESGVLLLAALHSHLDGADSAVLAEMAGITRRHAQRVLRELESGCYVEAAMRTIPWRHGTRRVRVWTPTGAADDLSPYLPRLHRSLRAACPETLPADMWYLFPSGPDPADIRLPRDGLLVANRLLNGRFLDSDAKRWALRHLPLEALRAQTGIPGCPPDVEVTVRDIESGRRG